MNRKLLLAAALSGFAIAALNAALLVAAFFLLPDALTGEYSGVGAAMAGALAAGILVVLLLVIMTICCAAGFVFSLISAATLLRIRRGKSSAKGGCVLLWVALLGTAGTAISGVFLCVAASPVTLALGIAAITAALVEAAVRIVCAVHLHRIGAPNAQCADPPPQA